MNDTLIEGIVNNLMTYELSMPTNYSYDFHIENVIIELTIMVMNNTRIILVSVGEVGDMGVCMAHIYPSEFVDDSGNLNYGFIENDTFFKRACKSNEESFKSLMKTLIYSNRIYNLDDDYVPEITTKKIELFDYNSIPSTKNASLFYSSLYRNSVDDYLKYYGVDNLKTIFFFINSELDQIKNNEPSTMLRLEINSSVELSTGESHYWQRIDIEPVHMFGELHVAIRIQRHGFESNSITSQYKICKIGTGGYKKALDNILNESMRVFNLVSSNIPVHEVKLICKDGM